MSYEDGWAAMNLQMPPRVPRTEFDAETYHFDLIEAVTGRRVDADTPPDLKQAATRAFIEAWNYDLCLAHCVGADELGDLQTRMGHAAYAADAADLDTDVCSPFVSPEEVLAFDPFEAYGHRRHADLVRRFNDHHRRQAEAFPSVVNTSGTYITLFSGLIQMFGWDLLLTAGGLDPDGLGRVADRYARWMQPFYDALADSDVPVIYSHDDLVWAAGPVFHPDWYRRHIFPLQRRLWAPCVEAGKKVLFICDGNYDAFVDDVAANNAAGFFLECHTNLRDLAERYGRTHVLIGNADTRILLSGPKEAIRAEVRRCMDVGRACPGFFMSVTNMIPPNTPVENAIYYNEVYEELSRR